MTHSNGLANGRASGRDVDPAGDHQTSSESQSSQEPDDGSSQGPESELGRRSHYYSSAIPRSRRFEKIAESSDPTGSMKGAAYQGAMEAVLAIVISTLLGYWADQHYDTAPRWLIVGVIIGFASFVLRLLRMGRLVTEAQTTAEEETNSGNRSKTEAGKQSERSES